MLRLVETGTRDHRGRGAYRSPGLDSYSPITLQRVCKHDRVIVGKHVRSAEAITPRRQYPLGHLPRNRLEVCVEQWPYLRTMRSCRNGRDIFNRLTHYDSLFLGSRTPLRIPVDWPTSIRCPSGSRM
jgi:hypothetical protein